MSAENKYLRAIGRTTRQIDNAIQELFTKYETIVEDHFVKDGTQELHYVARLAINNSLAGKIYDRLYIEHRINKNDLTREVLEDGKVKLTFSEGIKNILKNPKYDF